MAYISSIQDLNEDVYSIKALGIPVLEMFSFNQEEESDVEFTAQCDEFYEPETGSIIYVKNGSCRADSGWGLDLNQTGFYNVVDPRGSSFPLEAYCSALLVFGEWPNGAEYDEEGTYAWVALNINTNHVSSLTTDYLSGSEIAAESSVANVDGTYEQKTMVEEYPLGALLAVPTYHRTDILNNGKEFSVISGYGESTGVDADLLTTDKLVIRIVQKTPTRNNPTLKGFDFTIESGSNLITIDMTKPTIIGLADPTTSTGVATKNYVDNIVGDIETILASI